MQISSETMNRVIKYWSDRIFAAISSENTEKLLLLNDTDEETVRRLIEKNRKIKNDALDSRSSFEEVFGQYIKTYNMLHSYLTEIVIDVVSPISEDRIHLKHVANDFSRKTGIRVENAIPEDVSMTIKENGEVLLTEMKKNGIYARTAGATRPLDFGGTQQR